MKTCVAALMGVAAMVAGCRPDPPPTLEMGRDLYNVAGCVSCHGRSGHGDGPAAGQLPSPPRDLRDPAAFVNGRTVDDIALTIANGLTRNGAQMPAFAHLSTQEQKSLALYVLSLGEAPVTGAAPAAPAAGETTRPVVTARDAWLRAPLPSRDVAALFVTLENRGPEARAIVAASSPVAGKLEFHQIQAANGMMTMTPLKVIDLPPGTTELKPEGVHVMVFDLKEHPAEGATVAATLTLDNGQSVPIAAEVRPTAGTRD